MDSIPSAPVTPVAHYPKWRWIFPPLYVVIFLAPGWIFFSERGGLSWLNRLDAHNWTGRIFPLFGLYAITLVWFQVMLGSLLPLWRKIFPKIFLFHRAEGLFALLFALTHPSLLLVTVGLRSYIARDFVAPEQVKFLYFGYTALFIMLLTVTTALLMKRKILSRWWRKIHILNYVVFAAAWIHSYNLGSDVQSTGLKYLWFGYGLTVLIAIALRLMRQPKMIRHAPQP